MPAIAENALGDDRSPGLDAKAATDEVVPLLRPDLLVGRGAGPGLFELTGPEGGRPLVLADSELSVARMLDGRRRVSQVIENGERLGIPVDAGGLSKFVRQLELLGFLMPPGTKPASPGKDGPWPKRRPWNEQTRSLFQNGVRLMRQGQPDEAAPYFRKMLEEDPENPEAREMLCLVASGHSLAARPIGEVFERAPARSRRERRAGSTRAVAAAGLLIVALAAWRVGAGVGQAPGEAVAVRALAPRPPPAPNPPPPQAAPAPAAHVSAPVERRWHPALAEVRAPAAGELAWKEPLPDRVARGEWLGEIRGKAEPEAAAPEATQRLAQLERLAAEDPVYAEFLERERAALSQGAARRARVAMAAPSAGQASQLVRAGVNVGIGDLVAHIVDPESWRLSVLFGGFLPTVGAPCEVGGDGPSTTAECRVVEVLPAAQGARVTVAVRASAAPWLERARAPTVRFPGPTP